MKSKFLTKVLEIVNRKQKVNFEQVIAENIPNDVCIIQGKIYGRNFIHRFDFEIDKLDYKTIKKYADVLKEVIKNDKIMFKK